MIRTVVIGAAGRMGRRLVANIQESDTLELAGAVEYAESPFLGQDAGAVAGCGNAGVAITADLAGALKGPMPSSILRRPASSKAHGSRRKTAAPRWSARRH